jgi:DNA repair ATPase RecN
MAAGRASEEHVTTRSVRLGSDNVYRKPAMAPHASSDEEEVCECCVYERRIRSLEKMLRMYRDDLLHALDQLDEARSELRLLKNKRHAADSGRDQKVAPTN